MYTLLESGSLEIYNNFFLVRRCMCTNYVYVPCLYITFLAAALTAYFLLLCR